MTTSDPKGSIWRKWDLHFHTPASFDYENMSVTAKELVEALILNGISVVAVTDHHVIDAKRISEMREYAAGRITIFPGIELRSELGGSKCVHYIGIFPENCDVDELWRELDVKLEIAKQLKSRTNDEIYVKYQDGFNSIHKLGGVISIHAGNKSNSFEGIGKQNHQLAIKEDLLRGYIDILEVGNSKQVTGYLNHVFPDVFEKSEKTRPIIVCSDNHNIKNYDISSPLWIKADPNFFGLKQILIEPQDRVFLGKEPESQIKKRERSTHIIRNIEIKKKTNSTATHNWFSTKLTLNDGLIAIIGNKGSGKSALADIFGLLGNTRQSDKFSFLKATRFLNTKSRLAQEYNAVLYWESEDTSDKDLNEGCFPDDIETVKYIPQNYLEDICSELEDGKFNKELQEVIFSHIEIPDRLQTQSLEELLKIKKQQSDRRRETLVVSLKEVDRQIAELQYQTTISNKNALEARFNAKKKELDALDLAKPVEKQKPAENTVPKETASQIEALQGQVKSISEAIQNNTEESAMLAMKIAGVDRLSGKVSNFQRQYTSFLEDCQEDVAFLDIDLGDLLKIEVNLKPLHAKRQSYLDRRAKIIAAIDPNNAESLPAKLIVINKKLLEIQNELDGPNREYQSYLKELSDWETKRAAILGSENDTESFEGLKAVILKISEQYPKQIEELETKRESLSREIYDIIKESLKEYQSVYSPVQKFIDQQKDDAHRMQIEANIVQDKFSEKFFSLIDRSRKGSFRRRGYENFRAYHPRG
jgi:energy-coupling factor transporter ATP-binding protein EcfA2